MTERKAMEIQEKKTLTKNAVSVESFVFIALLAGFILLFGTRMGMVNMLNTMMNTAYKLLTDTVLYLTAVAVIIGALSSLLAEFGVVALLNKILSPIMRPLYNLPGASIMAVILTYLSDNPAVLTLADNKSFRSYFSDRQIASLTNLGTSFGMGLIISVFMLGLKGPNGECYFASVLIGNIGVVIGSIVSVRLMLYFTRDGKKENTVQSPPDMNTREIRSGGIGSRFINALMDGGKTGVNMGISIIPGVLIICTFVIMLSFNAGENGYTGGAYEGIGLMPQIGNKFKFILKPLLGFDSDIALSVPLTALGSAGAAISLIPGLLASGKITGDNIAVFTAICMCWSGYLSTHIAMMDALGTPEKSGKAIISHTIGGLVAGISAHLIYIVFM
ncbi:MAG TPA: hypothetical protein GXZ91_06515 [Christensenellaceae bacterium]|jgi:hypothetical protein|nr:hypothetical protein [Christensenellaceae bacterium]